MRTQTHIFSLKRRTHPLALARIIDQITEEEVRMGPIKQPKPIVTPPGGHPAPVANPGPRPPKPWK